MDPKWTISQVIYVKKNIRAISIWSSVCPSVCLSVCLCVCLSVSVSQSIHPSVCLSIYLSPSVCLSVCLSACVCLSRSLFLFVCLSVCLSTTTSSKAIWTKKKPSAKLKAELEEDAKEQSGWSRMSLSFKHWLPCYQSNMAHSTVEIKHDIHLVLPKNPFYVNINIH